MLEPDAGGAAGGAAFVIDAAVVSASAATRLHGSDSENVAAIVAEVLGEGAPEASEVGVQIGYMTVTRRLRGGYTAVT